MYMDDIVINSRTFCQHIKDADNVLCCPRGAKLKLNPPKCLFLKAEAKYLGHQVSAAGVRPDIVKMSSVQSFLLRTKPRHIPEFCGLIKYYQRHVDQFSRVGKSLTRLIVNDSKSEWTDYVVTAFLMLRDGTVQNSILGYPVFRLPFILETHASQYALGVVLSQRHRGLEHPVAFACHQPKRPNNLTLQTTRNV